MHVEAVPIGGNDHAVVAAVLALRCGLLDDLLLLLLLLVRRRVLLIGLLRLLPGLGLRLLLLGGLLGLGLVLLLLLGRGGHRSLLLGVVVIVATADQGEAGGADTGAPGGAQEGAPAHPRPPHPLPVVAFRRHFAPSLSNLRCGKDRRNVKCFARRWVGGAFGGWFSLGGWGRRGRERRDAGWVLVTARYPRQARV